MLEKMMEEFEKRQGFPVHNDMDIQTEVAWENWQAAWTAATTAKQDCRLCAHYTTDTGGCMAIVQCVRGAQFKATAPCQYWIAGEDAVDGNPDTIAEHLRGMLADGTTQCPLCGETWVHTHSPREIVIYRNGIKYGRSLAVHNA